MIYNEARQIINELAQEGFYQISSCPHCGVPVFVRKRGDIGMGWNHSLSGVSPYYICDCRLTASARPTVHVDCPKSTTGYGIDIRG